ncbi:MAG: response regulator transcription factor [Bacteroidales bacterium]|jgi:DNA-binding NarL/FixJ family response regulator|nr:response regulator transcription factor [Bacteroidales bacterium]NCU35406.1 response regulator transcription factor [Candidatus Falkowbacteria bacterium]MDD2631749.1 response regulator transcription factor [Bacteroidales bacterium]MDD3132296.1 response regulator transcription factor [Bacteroidales bacterium]MDD3525420.1 response regulator transcription factor [Bacteroidales bacterium]
MCQKPIQVLVVDDHQIIIDGMKSILQDEETVQFAGGANTMQEALDFIDQHQVDVIIMDISMPGHSGIEITRMIKEKYPDVKVLALTMHDEIDIIADMIDAGASGYLLKKANMNEVLDALQTVARGQRYLGSKVQDILMDDFSQRRSTRQNREYESQLLTPREKEILQLMLREFSNDKIAEKLFISIRTVETHRRNIFTKTNTKNVVGLIKYAMKQGLTQNESQA